MIYKKSKKRIEIENKIFNFCLSEKKHFDEIQIHLDDMNHNTLRAKYIYPMVNQGKLKKAKGRWYLSIAEFKES